MLQEEKQINDLEDCIRVRKLAFFAVNPNNTEHAVSVRDECE